MLPASGATGETHPERGTSFFQIWQKEKDEDDENDVR
jgi:hypothetical protein